MIRESDDDDDDDVWGGEREDGTEWIDEDAWAQRYFIHVIMIGNSFLVIMSVLLLGDQEPAIQALYVVGVVVVVVMWACVELLGTKLGHHELDYARFVAGASVLGLIIGVFAAFNDGTALFGYASVNQFIIYPLNFLLYIIVFRQMYHPRRIARKNK